MFQVHTVGALDGVNDFGIDRVVRHLVVIVYVGVGFELKLLVLDFIGENHGLGFVAHFE